MKVIKKSILAILTLAALCACASAKKQKKDEKAPAPQSVGIANPFKSCKSLKDAEKAAGFDFNLLDVFEDCAIQVYRAIPKQMIEAIYDSESGDEIRIRKAPGKNDPSGDFNIYTEKSSQTVDGHEITFYANGNKCGKAVWQMGGYTCSITSRDRISVDKALKAAQKIIEMNAAR